jgi:hypothetical protein
MLLPSSVGLWAHPLPPSGSAGWWQGVRWVRQYQAITKETKSKVETTASDRRSKKRKEKQTTKQQTSWWKW